MFNIWFKNSYCSPVSTTLRCFCKTISVYVDISWSLICICLVFIFINLFMSLACPLYVQLCICQRQLDCRSCKFWSWTYPIIVLLHFVNGLSIVYDTMNLYHQMNKLCLFIIIYCLVVVFGFQNFGTSVSGCLTN